MSLDIKKMIPEKDHHFYLPKDAISNLGSVSKLSQKHPVNILITGKEGCGKSSLVRQYAAKKGLPMATFQIGILSEPGQLFGEHRLKDGETYYQPFLFPEAIQTPGCVIHLEEINRPEHPKALNMLFSLLSDDRQVWTDEMGLIKVADGVVFFATLNEGEEFVGTEMLDAALRDRFYILQVGYLPGPVEKQVLSAKTGISEEQALTIVNIANKIRGNPKFNISLSTRHALMIAELLAVGTPIQDAFALSLQVNQDVLESILLSLHLGMGAKGELGEVEYELY
ncbi:AAA family ATPase [Desulfobacter sp. UBA2225]|uniref:AAA family ATPase n=1 Tax=Desulfobacter sp. UBA2225 TaxID=1961413 RepID=UPI00257DCFD4|nr:AAA family ATPase [Desulfobacter sp. UBA2225]